MNVQVNHRLLTNTEYHKMIAAGILHEDEHLELIQGKLIQMSPIGAKHAACLRHVDKLLNSIVSEQVLISTQNPIVLGDGTEPEPDIALLKMREDFYARAHPTPKDIYFLIEIADYSLDYDRQIKVPIYAKTGIAQVWIIDVNDPKIIVHDNPLLGSYQNTKTYTHGNLELPLPNKETLNVDNLLKVFSL